MKGHDPMPKDEAVPTDEQAAAAMSNLAYLINNQGDEDEIEEMLNRTNGERPGSGTAQERGNSD
jgi:hypothetical protein